MHKIKIILIITCVMCLLFVSGCISEDDDTPIITKTYILNNSMFDGCENNNDLRTGNDWYESRAQAPELLLLDETNVDGNYGKKAKIQGDQSLNTYLTQQFTTTQTGIFTIYWDIYVDEIMSCTATNTNRDRGGWMLIGFDGDSGPNRLEANRFVYMAFDKTDDDGGDDGTMELVTRDRGQGFNTQTVQKVMNLDQWYTIKVVLDIPNYTYDLYVDNEFINTVETWNSTALNFGNGASHISFASWNDGPGTFYIDNVYAYYEEE